MILTWDELRAIREADQRPGLPVIVTLDRRDAFAVFTPAFAVIVHEPGKAIPLEVLDGLAVILRMPCPKAARVARALRAKGVKPTHCESWCACLRELTNAPATTCRFGVEIAAEWEAPYAAA